MISKGEYNVKKNKTSIVFTGDIGFDRYMDKRWEDDNLLSKPVLDFFQSADHVVANVEGTHMDFNIIVPYAQTADEGRWEASALGAVKEYLLRQL